MGKFRSGYIFFFIPLVFLVPALAYPQSGGEGLEQFMGLLKGRGISAEQGFLFPGAGNEADAAETGFSLLVRFPGNAGTDGEAPDSGGSPLMIAAFPLENGARPGAGDSGESAEGLSCPLITALALAEHIQARQAGGRGFPGNLLVALLGEQDIRRIGENRRPTAEKLAAFGDSAEEPEPLGGPPKTSAFWNDALDLYVFWYFDFDRAPPSLRIRHGTSRTIAPLDALTGLPDLLMSLDIPYTFAVPFNELYKLGFAEGPEILRFAQEQEIRALVFSGGGALDTENQERISGDALAALIFEYAEALEKPDENPDYHYLIIPLRNGHVFLSQDRIVLLLLLIAALFFAGLLIYAGVRPPRPARILVFFRCSWVIPGLFLLFFAALEGAGLLASLLAGKGENRVLILYGWALWKIILGLGFFALISIPLGGYRIPLRAKFYGTAALLLIVLDTLAAAWLDICFVPFFTAAFLLIFLGTCIPYPVPVYCCAAAAPFYGFIAGIFSIRSGYGGLGDFLLSPRPLPAAMMILVFLPFVLLFKRGIVLSRQKKPAIRRGARPLEVSRDRGLNTAYSAAHETSAGEPELRGRETGEAKINTPEAKREAPDRRDMLFSKGIGHGFNTLTTAPATLEGCKAPPAEGGLLGINPSPRIEPTGPYKSLRRRLIPFFVLLGLALILGIILLVEPLSKEPLRGRARTEGSAGYGAGNPRHEFIRSGV